MTIAPLTKLILTIFVTIWAMLLHSLPALGLLILCQILLLLVARVSASVLKAIAGLFLFAALLSGLQYGLGNGDMIFALISGAKMAAMTLVFFLLLATTKMQDLSAALVSQCHVPREYAFMITAALRFVPDFLAESKAIQEAQACRGYSSHGNPIRRLTSYMAILKPLVLKAVSRSEIMAMSLELRGFGNRQARIFSGGIALKPLDYSLMALMLLFTGYLLF